MKHGNGNLRNENENSLAEVETKTERRFQQNSYGNGSFCFRLIRNSVLWLFYMANLGGSICELVVLNCQNNSPLISRYIE
jgi:hypothetical protein